MHASSAATSAAIPGQPTIVPKNMPGAASGRAAGYISAIAPKDGTAIAAVMPGAVMGPLLDEKAEALFDPTKVNYLGTANNGNRVCVTLKGTKIKSFDDTLSQKAVFGGVSTNDSTYEYGHLLKRTAGRPVRRGGRLSRHARYRAGDGARRGRRRLRMGLVELQVADPTGCATTR